MERTQEVQENLLPQFPNFSKIIQRSHVRDRFRLGLPRIFCDIHLPKHDEIVVLVDENEQEYGTKYMVNRYALSGGWRDFALAHKLREGDFVVFQLVQPCKFKVYITGANRLSEVDGVIGLLNLDFHDKPIDAVTKEDPSEKGEWIGVTKKQKTISVDSQKEKNTEALISDNEPVTGSTSGSPHSCIGVESTSATERAPEVQANLLPQFPAFSKVILRSHVCGDFRVGLPKIFCDVHLPKHDETVVLVDENEQEYNMKYMVNGYRLSGGWRGFALAQKLMEKDVVVFLLVQPCKFKVYITRASGKSEDLISNNEPATDQCGDKTYNNSGSENVERIQLSESVVNFKDVKEFKEFTISVDGLILDSELATHLRKKYYELCCSQKMFLHENLIYGLNIKLTTGIISETVNIADAIRAVKTATSVNDLESWDKTLKAFEDLGMLVGFLRARIRMIIDIPREYQDIIESKRREKAGAEDEMRRMKEKPFEVEALIKSLDEDIDTLTVKNEGLGFVIRSVASAPW